MRTIVILFHPQRIMKCSLNTVFAQSDAAATIKILFHRPILCGVYSRAATIQERCLLIPVAAREVILRETVD